MKKGFTLLELLIVITILAILAGAMMPIFSTSKSSAESAKALADLDAIKSSAIMYHYDNERWPPAGNAGTCLVMNATGCSNGTWNGPYMASWGNDPWKNAYAIYNNTTAQFAQSGGPDGIVSTCGTNDTCVLITIDKSK